jgi:hypothetical protein
MNRPAAEIAAQQAAAAPNAKAPAKRNRKKKQES